MERLRFLHIPKTAGSSFTIVLERQYRRAPIFTFTGNCAADKKRFSALSETEREQILLFTGHAPIFTGIKEADSATIITFLREPVSRVKSFCQFVAEGKSPYLLRNFPPDSFDLDRFLDSGSQHLELSNLQTKMLINSENCASPGLLESMPAPVARDRALDNLYHKVGYFGLQEYFNESLIYLASMLNWKAPLYYFSRRKKSAVRQIKFEERHLQRIADLNAIDMEVYEHARQKFMKVLDNPAFDNNNLRRLRLFNPLAAPWVRVERMSMLVRRLWKEKFREHSV